MPSGAVCVDCARCSHNVSAYTEIKGTGGRGVGDCQCNRNEEESESEEKVEQNVSMVNKFISVC